MSRTSCAAHPRHDIVGHGGVGDQVCVAQPRVLHERRVVVLGDRATPLGDPTRAAFARIRDVVVAEVPDAAQGRSYGLPALRHRDKPLIGFAVAKGHLSVFPFSSAALDAVRGELGGFDVSKGTLRFVAERPVPDDVVTRLVRARAAEIEGRSR
jgi:uncharacterized protein YdhG (YjbR/CyaY superfamily)